MGVNKLTSKYLNQPRTQTNGSRTFRQRGIGSKMPADTCEYGYGAHEE